MSYRHDIETPSARQLFETGYEHIVDSMRTGTTDSARERAEAAHRGAMLLAAAQAAALIDLVEAQRAANTIAAYAHPHGAIDTPEEFRTARGTARNVLGLDTVAEATEWGAER